MSAMGRCSCGGALHMAEGGSVEDKPFVGYRSAGRRKEKNNDRTGAKEVPVQALRGLVTGTLGLPGDIEKLGRLVARYAGAGVDETPFLPTSEFYSDVLPVKPTSAAGRAAEGAGQMLAPTGPLGAAKVAAPVVRTAGKEALRAVDKAMLGEGSSALRAIMAPSQPAFAVKPKGGNWVGSGPDSVASKLHVNLDERMVPSPGPELPSVNDWLDKRLPSWVRTHMGTKDDPLLQLEKEGNLHLTETDLAQMAQNDGIGIANTPFMYENGVRDAGTPEDALGRHHSATKADPDINPENYFHQQATGRRYRTPWENVSDALVSKTDAGYLKGNENTPPWVDKLPDEAQLYHMPYHASTDVASMFSPVRSYLDQALEAGRQRRYGNPDTDAKALIDRGLDLDQTKLMSVSLPDAVRQASEYGAFLKETEKLASDLKGIKQVIKQYPSGDQWVELNSKGLHREGEAMQYCVGGYCSSVDEGDVRVLSLRDKNRDPHITVELKRNLPDVYKLMADSPEKRHPVVTEVMNKVQSEFPEVGDNMFWEMVHDGVRQRIKDPDVFADIPWDIHQIKGKQNRAPIAKYQKAAQDLVRNLGPWGEVNELSNAGLIKEKGKYWEPKEFEETGRLHGKVKLSEAHEPLGWEDFKSRFEYIPDVEPRESFDKSVSDLYNNLLRNDTSELNVPDDWTWPPRTPKHENLPPPSLPAVDELPAVPANDMPPPNDRRWRNDPLQGIGQLRGNFERRIEPPDDYD